MKKYTLDNYEEFCKNVLVVPPAEEFDNGSIDEIKWYNNHKIRIIIDEDEIELDYCADNVNEIEYALREMYEAEHGGPITTGNTDGLERRVNMDFKTKLSEAFKTHMFMKDREQHTVNELLYVLEHHSGFNGEDFNISIKGLDGQWRSIPCLDAFVSVYFRKIWFNDAEVEFEVEECGEEKYNCITIYECEREVNE